MIKNTLALLILMLFLNACVSQKKYQAQQSSFKYSQDSLLAVIQSLDYQNDTLSLALSFERGASHALLITQGRLQDRLDLLQLEIDKLGANASSTEQGLFADIRQKENELKAIKNKISDIQSAIDGNQQRLAAFLIKLQPELEKIKADSVGLRQRAGQLIIAIGEDALFRKGSTSSLLEEGKSLLDEVATTLLQYPEMQIQVIGHTDNRSVNRNKLDNWQYSALRAVSVVKYLTQDAELGANRVSAASKSEFEPLQSNETTEGRARNRRIELIIAAPVGFVQQKIQKIIQ